MQFSELTLEKIILEVRYGISYLFWDNSGKVMMQISAKYPQFELRDAKLSNVQSDWWSEGIVLSFSHEKADVTQDYPANLDTFKGVCGVLCDTLRSAFEVRTFTRVGVRYIFILPTKSREEARDLVSKMALLSVKAERLRPFGNGKVEEQQVLIRYEDDDRGFLFRIGQIQREPQLKIARPFVVDTGKFTQNAILFDVDCYTRKPLDPPIFMPSDFIRVTHKTVESSLLPLLGL
ncbi:MAG TPA: hypothetical protein VK775_07335 [Chthoniobacterales bacterium]|jgi:uncharacterized protein (TIGR04255 family)|nr:hypothetical protein [Chthoniobacterales bacterium]